MKAAVKDIARMDAETAKSLGIPTPEEAVERLEVKPKLRSGSGRLEAEKPETPVEAKPVKAEAPMPQPGPEAAEALKAKGVRFFKRGRRVHVNTGYFILSPPEEVDSPDNKIRSYVPEKWAGWTVTGWTPKK
jgi:hypothetical protein